jgi:hypothetical protein
MIQPVLRDDLIVQMDEDVFDQWVFSDVGGRAGARQRLIQVLNMRLNEVQRICELSQPQLQKLTLAGMGDVQRYFDSVDRAKQMHEGNVGRQEKMAEVLAAMRPLQIALKSTTFESGSLFHKTLHSTLTAAQLSSLEEVMYARNVARHHATIGLFVAAIDEQIPLDDRQREQFLALLKNEIPAPAMFSEHDQSVLLLQVGAIAQERLLKILDAAQYESLKRMVAGAEPMRDYLKQSGLLFNENQQNAVPAQPGPIRVDGPAVP